MGSLCYEMAFPHTITLDLPRSTLRKHPQKIQLLWTPTDIQRCPCDHSSQLQKWSSLDVPPPGRQKVPQTLFVSSENRVWVEHRIRSNHYSTLAKSAHWQRTATNCWEDFLSLTPFPQIKKLTSLGPCLAQSFKTSLRIFGRHPI